MYVHWNNVALAVSLTSTRKWLSIGDVSVASISPCLCRYTNIYIEITVYPLCPSKYSYLELCSHCVRRYTDIYTEITLCPLCPPEYGYLHFLFLLASVSPMCPRVYKYFHRNNVISTVSLVSTRIWLNYTWCFCSFCFPHVSESIQLFT